MRYLSIVGAVAALSVVGGSAWGGLPRDDGDPIRSPDGKWVVSATIVVDGKGEDGMPRRHALLKVRQAGAKGATVIWDTRKVLPESGAERREKGDGEPMQYGLILAGWSPDSEHVLFWPRWEFAGSLNVDGVSMYWIGRAGGTPVRLVDSMLYYADWFAFAPGGRYLAVTEGDDRMTWTNKRIAVLDTRTGKRTQLTPKTLAALRPRWSPDGKRIAYCAGPDAGEGEWRDALAGRRVWIVNADGAGAHAVTHDKQCRDEAPEWTPDGRRIVFVRMDKRDRAALWSMRPDGSDLRRASKAIRLGERDEYYGCVRWDRLFDWKEMRAKDSPQ